MAGIAQTLPVPPLVNEMTMLNAIRLAIEAGGGLPSGSTITDIINNVVSPTEYSVGYLGVPQNSQSADYITVFTDSGKQIYHPSADTSARTWTIASNATVAYPIGTAITFVNDASAGVITIDVSTDALLFAGTGAVGTRSLAAAGIATALKVAPTRWIISGTGLT